MSNHVHLLLEVPDKESMLEGRSEDEQLGRLGALKAEYSTKLPIGQARLYRENGLFIGEAPCALYVTRVRVPPVDAG